MGLFFDCLRIGIILFDSCSWEGILISISINLKIGVKSGSVVAIVIKDIVIVASVKGSVGCRDILAGVILTIVVGDVVIIIIIAAIVIVVGKI